MKLNTDILWGVLAVISFWNTINSILKLGVKIKYRMSIEDNDISMVATSIVTFILFILFFIY